MGFHNELKHDINKHDGPKLTDVLGSLKLMNQSNNIPK
jgi:hypothetical protein